MKKRLVFTLATCCILAVLAGCGSIKVSVPDHPARVIVSPYGSAETTFEYTEPEKVDAVAEYMRSLDLRKTNKTASEYDGIAYIITIVSTDGSSVSYTHFGNMFFRTGEGDWYALEYNQAVGLEELLYRLTPDIPAENPLF